MSKPRNQSIRSTPIGRRSPNGGVLGSGVTRSRGFNCHACGSWFGVFQNATSLNAGRNAINGPQSFALECPTCTHSDDYSTDEIVEMTPSGPPADKQGREA